MEAVEECICEMTDNLADMNWPTIGSQPIDKFNTERLSIMWFPEIFYGVNDISITLWQRGVTMSNTGKHLIKYAVKYDKKWIYPFVEHKIFAAWIQDIIEHHKTRSQSKFCMQQNPDLIHSILQ